MEILSAVSAADNPSPSSPSTAPRMTSNASDVLCQVVTEFSPPTASAMGLPWVYHERCRMSLEADYLQRFFAHTCNVAREAVASGASPPLVPLSIRVPSLPMLIFFCFSSRHPPALLFVPPSPRGLQSLLRRSPRLRPLPPKGAAVAGADGGTCTACIHVLSAILSWDFQRGGGGIGGGGFGFVPVRSAAPPPRPSPSPLLSLAAFSSLLTLPSSPLPSTPPSPSPSCCPCPFPSPSRLWSITDSPFLCRRPSKRAGPPATRCRSTLAPAGAQSCWRQDPSVGCCSSWLRPTGGRGQGRSWGRPAISLCSSAGSQEISSPRMRRVPPLPPPFLKTPVIPLLSTLSAPLPFLRVPRHGGKASVHAGPPAGSCILGLPRRCVGSGSRARKF